MAQFCVGANTQHLDESINGFELQILKSPPHSPKAYALCERLIGTIRRECRHRIDAACSVAVRSVLGGLHHEYSLQCALSSFCAPQPRASMGRRAPSSRALDQIADTSVEIVSFHAPAPKTEQAPKPRAKGKKRAW